MRQRPNRLVAQTHVKRVRNGDGRNEGPFLRGLHSPRCPRSDRAAELAGCRTAGDGSGGPRRNRRRWSEHPFVEAVVVVGNVPNVVADVGNLGIEGMPPRRSNRVDHQLALTGGNDLVVGPLEGPNRNVLELGRPSRVSSAGYRHERRPALWLRRPQAPRAVTTHRPAGEDAAMRIDGEFPFHGIENRQGPPTVRTRRRPGGQDASLRVFTLREDDEERKCRGPFLHERTQTDGRLQHAVGSPLTRPVEVENHGPFFVSAYSSAVRTKYICARRPRP